MRCGQQYPGEAAQTVAIVDEELGSVITAIYLFGSAVTGGLQRHSDVDVLAVVRKPLSPEVRQRLAEKLMKVSGARGDGAPARPIELTVIKLGDVVPWRYPPRSEFVYGEWLRGILKTSAAARPEPDPDLVILLRKARESSIAMVGPDARELLPPVPEEDVRRAMADSLPRLVSELDGDERNVLLTLARMWMTAATGEIRSKNIAAEWAMERLPREQATLLDIARRAYLGREPDDWKGRKSELDAAVGHIRAYIEQCLADAK